MKRIPIRYAPTSLSKRDKQAQLRMIRQSRAAYRKGKYLTRKKLASFPQQKSRHLKRAEAIYDVSTMTPTNQLAKKTGCSLASLKAIVRKGEGAYFSSGSRPSQTAQSWGIARLASSLTAGKAAAVDFSILKKGCRPGSKALRLAYTARKKHGHGTRRTRSIPI